jgi:NAD(P)-dependent dehydrogenase (short-subunit alcohol dehydrogenase family)
MPKLLEGKKVLITGASRGIGKELACACAREGAFLILCSEPSTKDLLEQVWGGGEGSQGS